MFFATHASASASAPVRISENADDGSPPAFGCPDSSADLTGGEAVLADDESMPASKSANGHLDLTGQTPDMDLAGLDTKSHDRRGTSANGDAGVMPASTCASSHEEITGFAAEVDLGALGSEKLLRSIIEILQTESVAATERHKEACAWHAAAMERHEDAIRSFTNGQSHHTTWETTKDLSSETVANPDPALEELVCSDTAMQRQGSPAAASTASSEKSAASSYTSIASQVRRNADKASKEFLQKLGSKRTSVLSGRDSSSACAIVSKLVRHEIFEGFIMLSIMVNSVVFCFEAQYNGLQLGFELQYPGYSSDAADVWPVATTTFIILSWVFGVLFTMEMVLKLMSFGVKYFYSGWNMLDMVCVLAFLADKVLPIAVPLGGQGLRMLRLLRIFRLVRLVRSMETVQHLYIMIVALRGMTMVLIWGVALLFLILMTVSLLLTMLLQNFYFDKASSLSPGSDELTAHQRVYAYFGTFSRCLLSMFEITLANWPPVTRLLVEEVSEWFMVACLAHKLTVGFAVVGVINGIILQETFKVSSMDDVLMVRQHTRQQQIFAQKMRGLFAGLDSEQAGEITLAQFESISTYPEIKAWMSAMGIGPLNDLPTLFDLIDTDRGGTISEEEWVSRIPTIRGQARGCDVMTILQCLNNLNNEQADGQSQKQRKKGKGDTEPTSPTSSIAPTSPLSHVTTSRSRVAV